MVLLIHHPFSPASRKIRIAMSEKKMLFVLKEEEPWDMSPDVFKLNPAGELPIFINDGKVISGNYVKIPMRSGGKRQDSAQTGRFLEQFSESRARVLVPKKGWCYTVPEDSPEGCPGKRD